MAKSRAPSTAITPVLRQMLTGFVLLQLSSECTNHILHLAAVLHTEMSLYITSKGTYLPSLFLTPLVAKIETVMDDLAKKCNPDKLVPTAMTADQQK